MTTAAPASLKELIENHPFLEGMKPEHLVTLEECAMLKEFQEGELIFREGDMANRFYLILEGKVALESGQREQDPQLVQHIGPGDVLGWSWLFPPYYWHFDARAAAPTKAIFFYGTRLREWSEEKPDLGYDLMKRMAKVIIERLQTTRRQLIDSMKYKR